MACQAAVLAGFGFLPATLPHSLVVVPISFLAGIQIGLFRSIGDLAYMPLATTGNLMRLVEAGYDFFVDKNRSSRRAFMVYACVIGAFAAGAIRRRIHHPCVWAACDLGARGAAGRDAHSVRHRRTRKHGVEIVSNAEPRLRLSCRPDLVFSGAAGNRTQPKNHRELGEHRIWVRETT